MKNKHAIETRILELTADRENCILLKVKRWAWHIIQIDREISSLCWVLGRTPPDLAEDEFSVITDREPTEELVAIGECF